jgi:hypothetical protein
MLLFCIVPFAGYAQLVYVNFDAGDTIYQNAIIIDTVNHHHNSWQVGKPSKTIFTAARSPINAIITDTLNPYPPNDTSVFILKIPSTNSIGYWVGEIQFYYQLNIDSGSQGIIEYLPDTGSTWKILKSKPWYPNQDSALFLHSTSSWVHYFIGQPVPTHNDSVMLRFTFISDSISSTKDGWIIDDFSIHYITSSVPDRYMNPRFSTYPNPAKNVLHIVADDKINQIIIYNTLGQCVCEQDNKFANSTQVDISKFATGMYFVKINGIAAGNFLKE